jgi:hypothetical protein
MNLLERIFAEPELVTAPPVLVDVGAAGGVHRRWRKIACFCIGVGFEPDVREAAPLSAAQSQFKRWVYCPTLVVPAPTPGDQADLHLTCSPQCSSTLRPNATALGEWAFADYFAVEQTRSCAATTLLAALAGQGIERIDWLKCDTQGLDLGIFRSLPEAERARLLAAEFEPGLIDAYEGEDKLADVLAAMDREPFWLADLEICGTVRGRSEMFTRHLGAGALPWVHRLAPRASAWANLRFLRDFSRRPEISDRRAHLLGWVFATIMGQHGAALTLAEAGTRHFAGPLFPDLTAASVRSLRWAMARNFPGWLWRRLGPG